MAERDPEQEGRTTAAVLPADAAARFVEFARTCKAAARAVALYPAAHPAIATSLARLAEASARLTDTGPCEIHVRAEDLLPNEARLPKPDPVVGELAALLYAHAIGRLTLNAGADAASWRTLLLLLARSPGDVRADGGIAHLWTAAGGPSIDIREVDYAEVLRERQGLAAHFDAIVAAALSGPSLALDDESMQALLEIVDDPAKLRQLLEQLEAAVSTSPDGVQLQTVPFLNMVRGLVEYVSHREPDQLERLFDRLGEGARHLSVDNMIALLAERSTPEAVVAGINVVSSVVEHMSDDSIAGFVADGVVAEHGATERLAHAFRALVPDFDRQRQLLALAREQTEASLAPSEDESFPELWNRVESMLTSYTDARYVSDDYARELLHARTQPIDVERLADDPPERVAAWLATVSDASLRDLDASLLRDLLAIEADPSRWRDLAQTVTDHAGDLVRVGHFEQAIGLVEAIVEEGGRAPDRAPHAASALERFGGRSFVRHLPACLREADDELGARVARICHAAGQPIIAPLAEALAAEQDARARRRLREILVGFGPRGAEAISPLLNAASWEVRRTAAYLLREFGGVEGLKELIPLLSDAEPLVRREAVQVLMLHGSREASRILLDAVLSARGRTREAIVREILGMRDDRAAPLFAHVLRELTPEQIPDLYAAAIEVLGHAGGAEAVPALAAALARGTWWAPLASRRFRRAAAQALGRIGTPEALAALDDAARRGPGGARAAARAALSQRG